MCVTDVMSPDYKAYSGNEATRFTIMHALGTSLLTSNGRHGLLYRAIATCMMSTKTGQMPLEQAKTVLLMSQILSQATP